MSYGSILYYAQLHGRAAPRHSHTANLRTEILDFRGFDPSIILILMGGIPRPIGNFPEVLSQLILVGMILLGRLGVHVCTCPRTPTYT